MSKRRIWSAIGEAAGTVVSLACLTIAAFTLGFAIGMAAAGVSLLLADFKVASMVARRKGTP